MFFISRCRYADNEYSNQFNISFAIVDIKCVQIYKKFEAKGIYTEQVAGQAGWTRIFDSKVNVGVP